MPDQPGNWFREEGSRTYGERLTKCLQRLKNARTWNDVREAADGVAAIGKDMREDVDRSEQAWPAE